MTIITTAMIEDDNIKEDKGLVVGKFLWGQMYFEISLLRSQMLLANVLEIMKAGSLTHATRL